MGFQNWISNKQWKILGCHSEGQFSQRGRYHPRESPYFEYAYLRWVAAELLILQFKNVCDRTDIAQSKHLPVFSIDEAEFESFVFVENLAHDAISLEIGRTIGCDHRCE